MEPPYDRRTSTFDLVAGLTARLQPDGMNGNPVAPSVAPKDAARVSDGPYEKAKEAAALGQGGCAGVRPKGFEPLTC